MSLTNEVYLAILRICILSSSLVPRHSKNRE